MVQKRKPQKKKAIKKKTVAKKATEKVEPETAPEMTETARSTTFMHPCVNCAASDKFLSNLVRAVNSDLRANDIPLAWDLDEAEEHYACRLCQKRHTILVFAHSVVQPEYFGRYCVHRAQLFM
jgi:phage gp29-like protein